MWGILILALIVIIVSIIISFKDMKEQTKLNNLNLETEVFNKEEVLGVKQFYKILDNYTDLQLKNIIDNNQGAEIKIEGEVVNATEELIILKDTYSFRSNVGIDIKDPNKLLNINKGDVVIVTMVQDSENYTLKDIIKGGR